MRGLGVMVGVAVGVVITGASARADALDCQLSDVEPVAFGGYDVLDPSPLDSTGGFTLTCSDVGVGDTVRIELGGGRASSFAPRTLFAGMHALAYQLFLDASRLVVWGDGTDGTSTYGPIAAPTGSTQIPIYARVPARQDVAVGDYTDTIVITLQY